MINQLKTLFSYRLGFYITPLSRRKEQPIPFTSRVAKKFLFYENMFSKIQGIDGSIVECGVGFGRSLYDFCLLSELEDCYRQIWGFDSFEGFPEPSDYDETHRTGKVQGHYALLEANKQSVVNFIINSGVEKEFLDTYVQLVKGFFPDSFYKYNRTPIALLHLDCDLYQSYMDSLEFFYPFVQDGGVIVFDDYARKSWPGAKRAVDKYFLGKGEILKDDLHLTGRHYLIKHHDL